MKARSHRPSHKAKVLCSSNRYSPMPKPLSEFRRNHWVLFHLPLRLNRIHRWTTALFKPRPNFTNQKRTLPSSLEFTELKNLFKLIPDQRKCRDNWKLRLSLILSALRHNALHHTPPEARPQGRASQQSKYQYRSILWLLSLVIYHVAAPQQAHNIWEAEPVRSWWRHPKIWAAL